MHRSSWRRQDRKLLSQLSWKANMLPKMYVNTISSSIPVLREKWSGEDEKISGSTSKITSGTPTWLSKKRERSCRNYGFWTFSVSGHFTDENWKKTFLICLIVDFVTLHVNHSVLKSVPVSYEADFCALFFLYRSQCKLEVKWHERHPGKEERILCLEV